MPKMLMWLTKNRICNIEELYVHNMYVCEGKLASMAMFTSVSTVIVMCVRCVIEGGERVVQQQHQQ